MKKVGFVPEVKQGVTDEQSGESEEEIAMGEERKCTVQIAHVSRTVYNWGPIYKISYDNLRKNLG